MTSQHASQVSRLTPANALTTLRLLLAPVCAYLIFEARDVEAVVVCQGVQHVGVVDAAAIPAADGSL